MLASRLIILYMHRKDAYFMLRGGGMKEWREGRKAREGSLQSKWEVVTLTQVTLPPQTSQTLEKKLLFFFFWLRFPSVHPSEGLPPGYPPSLARLNLLATSKKPLDKAPSTKKYQAKGTWGKRRGGAPKPKLWGKWGWGGRGVKTTQWRFCSVNGWNRHYQIWHILVSKIRNWTVLWPKLWVSNWCMTELCRFPPLCLWVCTNWQMMTCKFWWHVHDAENWHYEILPHHVLTCTMWISTCNVSVICTRKLSPIWATCEICSFKSPSFVYKMWIMCTFNCTTCNWNVSHMCLMYCATVSKALPLHVLLSHFAMSLEHH